MKIKIEEQTIYRIGGFSTFDFVDAHEARSILEWLQNFTIGKYLWEDVIYFHESRDINYSYFDQIPDLNTPYTFSLFMDSDESVMVRIKRILLDQIIADATQINLAISKLEGKNNSTKGV